DSPEDLVMDMLGETFFQGHPLANPISSSADIVGAYEAGDVRAYYRRRYLPANMVISVAGNFEPALLMDEVKRRFEGYVPGQPARRELSPGPCDGGRRVVLRDREFEQTHICLGFRGCPSATAEVYPVMVLNNILGGSMSSRLFQKVREAEGLVYSVYSFPSFFKQTGVFGVYAACKHANVARAMEIIAREIRGVGRGEIDEEEFCRAKEQLKGNYALSQDSVSSHMNAMGKNLLLHDRVIGEEETMEKINAVTLEDVRACAARILDPAYLAAAGVGRIAQAEQMKGILLD
ncbi:MAG: pitrilysin family protein, partial [Eubacteriales bacterium]|nr:pitrilysin family protein [Eubacteriales bacterium]